jgi:putative nucleotidyltransferase with HDIG domain
MKALAEQLGEDAGLWETIGLLHDIDFELIHGDTQQHGKKGADILIGAGIDPAIASIVQRHNHMLF